MLIDTENLFMTLFLTASSFCSIFTQVSKTVNSAVALQEVSWSVLRHSSSGFSLSLFCFFMWLQTDWWWSDLKHLTGLLQLMAKWMFGNVNWYFLLTLQQKIEITDLKPFLAAENTSILIILATAVLLYCKNQSFTCNGVICDPGPLNQS